MKTSILCLVLSVGLMLTAVARAGESKGKGHGPCKADVEKFCKDVKPGHGNIMKCLKEHEAELSEGCKAKKTAMKACKSDMEKFCKDVKPGHGAKMKCMKEHEAELSSGCKAEREEMKAKRKEFKDSHQ